jgi:glycosyltransferase involved in cell wall biosynthesis/tetratricopeptide (TPR) repeat protein
VRSGGSRTGRRTSTTGRSSSGRRSTGRSAATARRLDRLARLGHDRGIVEPNASGEPASEGELREWLADDARYPHTEAYDLDTLTPSPVLAGRLAALARLPLPPWFWHGEPGSTLLSVGAGKAFFERAHWRSFEQIVVVDPSPRVSAALERFPVENAVYAGSSLFALDPSQTTATHAWLGASSHHVFREFYGWEFMEKLAMLVSGTVVIDGGVFELESRSGRELASRWTGSGPLEAYREEEFSHAAFRARIDRLWDVVGDWVTPWAPERRTLVLERRLPPVVERSSLEPLETVRTAPDWAVHRTAAGYYRECSSIATLLAYDTVSKLMEWDLVLARVEDAGRFAGVLTRDCGHEFPSDSGIGERLHLSLASRLLPLGVMPVDLARENIRLVGGRPVCIDVELRTLSRLDARTALASVTSLYKQYESLPADIGGAAARAHARVRRPRPSRRDRVPLVWSAPLFDTSGYAEEARQFILALDDAGFDVHADPVVWAPWQARLSSGAAERLERMLALDPPQSFVHVIHTTPHTFVRHPHAVRTIGRTMLETDGLPPDWVTRCNELDEIWVPSAFNLDTFARAGVAEEKLHRVPEPLRRDLYQPVPPPLPLEGVSGFGFLCVLAWGLRKGWDVLVRAYCQEFGPGDDVTLVLKADTPPGRSPDSVRAELAAYLRDELGRGAGSEPRIVLLLDRALGDEEMVRLYRAADCYVMPSRGEGWGRTYMEAMAVGLPTIGTRWSGNLEFMSDENAYLVDCDVVAVPEAGWAEAPAFRGHRWAEPSVAHLRTLMRRAYTAREEAAAVGSRARADVLSRFSGEQVAAEVASLLRARGMQPPRKRRRSGARLRVTWEGDQFAEHSLAIVNRDLCRALLGTGQVDLGLVSDAPSSADASLAALAARVGPVPDADVHVRHAWPPDFQPPDDGRFVLIQPWEYGSVPAEWVERIDAVVDELWVPSRYVRDAYVASGVAPERVAVVPNGVDPILFNPGVMPAELPTEKRFRFLFVGGTLARKGADLLLEAYLRAFGPEDDVCLVVKDFGTDSFYRGQGLGAEIRRLAEDPDSPAILYLDGTLPRAAMGGLFTACHCLVHPYRGEGFALPIAEAMACGLAVVATGHGACLDFCDPSTAYLLPAREVSFPGSEVGGLPTVGRPTWAEPDRDVLEQVLRHVYEHPDEGAALGRRASLHAIRELAWRRSADAALARLTDLAGVSPVRSRPHRRRSAADAPAPGLSLCVIARDEEEHIAGCLESVRGLADQVIVVDTGSTDGTIDVARSHGAEVHVLDWDGDFAAARNEALRHARHAWILVLDADERLERESHAEVRSLVGSNRRAGYLLRMLSYLDRDGRGAVLEHPNLRLFPSHPDIRYEGRDPHAQVVYRGAGELPLASTSVVVHHEGYRPHVYEAKGKGERNLGYLERAVIEQPHEPFHAYNLGVTYALLGRDADAEQMLLRSIGLLLPEVRDGRPPAYLAGAYLSLALALFRQARFAEAGAYGERALALAPGLSDAHVVVGAARCRLGNLGGALAAYEEALSSDGSGLEATDRASSTWKPLLGIGEVMLLQRRWADALAALDRARELKPDEPGLLVARARALVGLGRIEEAERELRAAIAADTAEPDAWVLLAEVRLLAGRRDEAEQTLRDGLFRHPEAEVLFDALGR